MRSAECEALSQSGIVAVVDGVFPLRGNDFALDRDCAG